MPYVRVAWYSTKEDKRYHICTHCTDSERILQKYIMVATEEEMPDHLEQCATCKDLLDDECCAYLVIAVS